MPDDDRTVDILVAVLDFGPKMCYSLGPIGAPKGRRAKCKLSPLSDFFLSETRGEYET